MENKYLRIIANPYLLKKEHNNNNNNNKYNKDIYNYISGKYEKITNDDIQKIVILIDDYFINKYVEEIIYDIIEDIIKEI